jgi:hypothetical protein
VPFIRLCDNYVDHPKIDKLGDGAFRLWHQGLAFCRRFQTDGMIPYVTARGLKAYSPKRARELCAPWTEGATALWVETPGFGYRVHDYLEWNPTKDEENERRTGTRDRMRQFRERRSDINGAPGTSIRPSGDAVTAPSLTRHTPSVTNAHVPDRIGIGQGIDREKGSGEKPDLGERARWLLESYPEWFQQARGGAKLRIVFNSLQFGDAMSLCETWDNARLEKLAKLVLTTDDPFISGTDRGFKIFAMKASWADDRLKQWELANGVAV